MALGSTAGSVLNLVAREALVLIAAGAVSGIAISIVAWRLLAHYVPAVSSIDAPILLACAAVMLLLASAAVTVPAIRASRIDPLDALRHQ
jgi:ABC-type antimicrobial peptide transport system permease subunit